VNDLKERDTLPGFEERLLGELLVLVERRSGTDGAPPLEPRRRQGRRRTVRALLAAAVLAVAIAIVVPLVVPADRPGGPEFASAAAVLHRLARVAGNRRADAAPSAGQYVYTKSRYTQTMSVGSDGPGGSYRYVESAVRQIWIAPDGSGRLAEVSGDASFPTPADQAAWRADGSQDLGAYSGADDTYQAGGLFFQDLSGFSTQQGQLKSELAAYAKKQNESMFEAAGDLLRETYAPPELRAALFDVVAELPGVEYLGNVTDDAGRSGVALGVSKEGQTDKLIFDKHTSALLGESTVTDASAPPSAGSA